MDYEIKSLKRILAITLSLIFFVTGSTLVLNSSDPVIGASKTSKTKINKVVQVAKKKKGKTITSFPKYFHRGRWCSDFVHWCAKKAKLTNNKVYPKTARGVSGLISWYKKKDRYYKNTKKFKPKKGDLVFLSTSSHVGIVAKVTKKYVYVIHGNWSNKVKYTKLKKNGYTRSQKAKIKGFARPSY